MHLAPQEVHSFDLVATAPGVVACNMAAVPLDDSSVDAAVFCLALMGTDYGSFLQVTNAMRNKHAHRHTVQAQSSPHDTFRLGKAAVPQLHWLRSDCQEPGPHIGFHSGP